MSKVTVIGIVGNSVFLPVDHFHIGGETIEATGYQFEYGGKGFNQAVAAARFGAEVTFIAAIGEKDVDGVADFLKGEQICPILVPKDMPSAFAAIITDKTGANHVTVYQGACLKPEDLSQYVDAIKSCDVLLINNEIDEAVNAMATEIAAANGAKIILNPAPQRATDQAILNRVTYFTPNEHEAEGLEAYPNVIQTLGKQGCWIKAGNVIVPPTDDIAVDTTGAGDTFNGALAAELAQGADIESAVRTAVKASGKSVTRKGAVTSIPYRNEI